MSMHYDNRYTAQYMEEQANLEVGDLKWKLRKLEKEKAMLEDELERLKKHLEIIKKHP